MNRLAEREGFRSTTGASSSSQLKKVPSRTRKSRIVLFTEANSPFGEEFIHRIYDHLCSDLVGIVTREQGVFSPDYDVEAVDNPHLAEQLGIPILRASGWGALVPVLQKLDADFFMVANYQKLLPREIYQLPKKFSINFHVGPLPRYAGLTPWHWMERNRETEGGWSPSGSGI